MQNNKSYQEQISKQFKRNHYQKGKKSKGRSYKSKKDFSLGEKSPYRQWKEKQGGIDPLDIEGIFEDENPFKQAGLSNLQENQLEALKSLKLKGRQQEVVEMLWQGHTKQTLIATMLGISQPQVARIIKIVRNKINRRIQYGR